MVRLVGVRSEVVTVTLTCGARSELSEYVSITVGKT